MDETSARKALAKLGVPIVGRSQTGWLKGHCPLAPWTHEKGTDNKPAFGVLINEAGTSWYKCLACHYKGRMSQLVRTLEGFSGNVYPGLAVECDMADMNGVFGSGFDIQHQMLGYEEPEPVDEAAIKGIYPEAADIPRAMAYLQFRGIGKETAQILELKYDPGQQRILFPVRGQAGELYGFSGRTILEEREYPSRKTYPKIRDYLGLPKRALLLGMNLYQQGKPAFVVEGLIGYANLVQQGAREICNPLALLGSEMTQQKAGALSLLDERTYIMPDDDAAGEDCLWGNFNKETGEHDGDGAVSRLRRKGVATFVPEWPQGKTDPDQLSFEDVAYIVENCPIWTEHS